MALLNRLMFLLALGFLPSFPASGLLSSSPSSGSCALSGSTDHDLHSHGHCHDPEHIDSVSNLDDGHSHDHDHSHSSGCGCIQEHDDEHIHSHLHHSHHHHHECGSSESSHVSEHKLPEELAEEEELRLFGFESQSDMDEGHHHHHHHHQDATISSVGLWVRALGCSLLVSMASLICLILLPLIVSHGKPSRTVVDFLAAFGAGAMLGDAFLHQLPHALGGSHAHSHFHAPEHKHGLLHDHHEGMENGQHFHAGHSHSIQDLSVGLAVLAGIILFFLVEKIVRQVEDFSSNQRLSWGHHHHHQRQHAHQSGNNEAKGTRQHVISGDKDLDQSKSSLDDAKGEDSSETSANGSPGHGEICTNKLYIGKKTGGFEEESERLTMLSKKDDSDEQKILNSAEQAPAPNLILGYLNLFSDGVHNFTDGMALGAAFLNHGTLGGWSRTLFLLAHELPQEVGDFGILVQSGFGVLKALAFNFLSALVALAGTALALVLGGDPGHSSLIEGFTAGGFIYIAVAGVLPEMHQHGNSMKATFLQLVALILGMGVALTISLVE